MTEAAALNRVFISYESETGLALAKAIRAALRRQRVQGWVWALDHPSGYVSKEIAKRIQAADYICWVCTEGSLSSGGQDWEIDNAFGQGKANQAWVVSTDRRYVPIQLMGYYSYTVSLDNVDDVVGDWGSRCRNGFPDWPSLEADEAQTNGIEGSDIKAIAMVIADA